MLTLVFDTCFNKTYIVLKNDSIVLSSLTIESDDNNYHSVYLIPQIRDILKANSLLISDLDAIGVNIGPGSFTGIRAGITIARVLAQQTDIKLVGVSSLEILSNLSPDFNNKTAVILDARKNKVYYAMYKNGLEIVPPSLVEKEEIIEKITGCAVISDSTIHEFLIANSISSINFELNDSDLGLYLSDVVCNKLLTLSDDFNWAKVKPLYIQKPSITKPKELKNV